MSKPCTPYRTTSFSLTRCLCLVLSLSYCILCKLIIRSTDLNEFCIFAKFVNSLLVKKKKKKDYSSTHSSHHGHSSSQFFKICITWKRKRDSRGTLMFIVAIKWYQEVSCFCGNKCKHKWRKIFSTWFFNIVAYFMLKGFMGREKSFLAAHYSGWEYFI